MSWVLIRLELVFRKKCWAVSDEAWFKKKMKDESVYLKSSWHEIIELQHT